MLNNNSPIVWVCTNREISLSEYPHASWIAIGDTACKKMLAQVVSLFSWRKSHFNPHRDHPFRFVVDEDIDIGKLTEEFVLIGGRFRMYLTVRNSTEE